MERAPSLSVSTLLLLAYSLMSDGDAPVAPRAPGVQPPADPNMDVLFTDIVAPAATPQPAGRGSLADHVVAPTHVTSAGGVARQLTERTWHVPQHVALEAFLYVSGPPEIVRYNFSDAALGSIFVFMFRDLRSVV